MRKYLTKYLKELEALLAQEQDDDFDYEDY